MADARAANPICQQIGVQSSKCRGFLVRFAALAFLKRVQSRQIVALSCRGRGLKAARRRFTKGLLGVAVACSSSARRSPDKQKTSHRCLVIGLIACNLRNLQLD